MFLKLPCSARDVRVNMPVVVGPGMRGFMVLGIGECSEVKRSLTNELEGKI